MNPPAIVLGDSKAGEPRLVSIVVLSYNGRHYLPACLSSVSAQTYRALEIILVDNGSSDGTAEWVRTEFPNVKLVRIEQNAGFCAGNNIGIRAARGEYIALLNNDTRVVPGWVAALVDAIDSDPSVGMVASLMVYFDPPHLIDTAGDLYDILGRSHKRGHGSRVDNSYRQAALVFAACGGAALYRRRMLNQIGLLDEAFFNNKEDVDLAFRGRLRGWECVYAPQALVYHVVGGTDSHVGSWTTFVTQRNVEYVFFKNMPWPLLLLLGLPHVLGSLVSVILRVAEGRGAAAIRGKQSFFKNWRYVWRARRQIQRTRTISWWGLLRRMEVWPSSH